MKLLDSTTDNALLRK